MQNIADVVVDYTNRGKILDKKAWRYIIEYEVKRLNIQNYFNKVKYTFDPTVCGFYCSLTKDIHINPLAGNRNGEKSIDKTLSYFGEDSTQEKTRLLCKNLNLLEILLHETEHANQSKLVDENNHNLETKLLKIALYYLKQLPNEAGLSLKTKKKDKMPGLLLSGFDYPIERFANIKSAYKTELVSDIIGEKVSKYYFSFHSLYILSSYYLAHSETLSPSMEFLNILQQFNPAWFDYVLDDSFYDLLKKEMSENLSTRMYFGLPISSEEKKYVKQKL